MLRYAVAEGAVHREVARADGDASLADDGHAAHASVLDGESHAGEAPPEDLLGFAVKVEAPIVDLRDAGFHALTA